MNKTILTTALILTCVSVATATRGPRTRPVIPNKQGPTVSGVTETNPSLKGMPRTPRAVNAPKLGGNVIYTHDSGHEIKFQPPHHKHTLRYRK